MNLTNLFCSLLFAVLPIAILSAQEADDSTRLLPEVVVTGTRYEIPVEASGKTIYRLDSSQLAHRAGKSTADVLHEIPGLHLDGNFGAPGANLSYYARGGRNRQSLVLIDGIPLNDPSGITLTYDLRYLPLQQLSSIEVLKGGLSTLYGSGAAASVINIQLTQPGDQPIQGYVDVHAGSFRTFGQHAQLSGMSGPWSYLLTAQNSMSRGFSAALPPEPNADFDDDGFSRQNSLLKLSYQANKHWKIGLSTAIDRFETAYDDAEFTDAANTQRSRQVRVGLHPSYTYQQGTVGLNAVYNRNHREFESSYPAEYEGNNVQLDLTQKHRFSSRWKGVWGANIQHLSYAEAEMNAADTTSFTIADPYASLIYQGEKGLNLHAGVRLNTHSEYGTQAIYNLNPSYLLSLTEAAQLKLLASWSTAYVTPSLYQLYSLYGNDQLDPESSENWEGGMSWYYQDLITLNTVYFRRYDQEVIDFVSRFDAEGNYLGGHYENLISDRQVYGVEADTQIRLSDQVRATAFYTFTKSNQPESLWRIPHHKAGGSVTVRATQTLDLTLRYLYTGDRITPDFVNGGTLTLHEYHLFDLYGQYGLGHHWRVYGTLNNLFDTDFVGVYGFTTRGRNGTLGVQYRF